MTSKQIILAYLADLRLKNPNDGWIREYELRRLNTRHGWIGPRGDRDTRDLIDDWLVEAGFDGKYRIVRAKIEPRITLPDPYRKKVEKVEEKIEDAQLALKI